MTDGDRELLERADAAAANAYAPYSEFHVGAAVRTRDGRIFEGVNVENAAYPLGICGEKTALAAKGMYEAPVNVAPDLVVRVDYGIGPPQVRRVMARDGLSEHDARARLAAQWPIEEKVKRASYVIWTDRGFAETDRQIAST